MQADLTNVLRLVHRYLNPAELRDSRVYFDTELKNAGEPVRVGLREISMPYRGLRVFVDLMPNANWGHHVVYLLATEDLNSCVRYDEQFPPFGSTPPQNWHAMSAQ